MKKLCCICGSAKEINLLIKGKMICRDCEWRIIKSKICDRDYEALLKRIGSLDTNRCSG